MVEAFHEDEESHGLQIEVRNTYKLQTFISFTISFNFNTQAENPKDVKVTNNDKQEEEETKQLNEDMDNNKEDEKSQEEKQEQESPASDIAEFTIDDIKTLAGDKTDN